MTGQQILARIKERDDGEMLKLIRTFAKEHYVTPVELLESKEPAAASARFAVWNAMLESGIWSYSRLGQLFDRDHTTIRAGINVHRKRHGLAPIPKTPSRRYVPPGEAKVA